MTKVDLYPCSAKSFHDIGRCDRWGNCRAKGRYEYEGNHYCGTHYPPAVEKRRAESQAKYDAENQRSYDAMKERHLAAAALEWLRAERPEIVREVESKS